ncbi:glycosyltransferase [Desertifilum sp. FACHB-1129]|uniref:Glycosyl transferase family A n=2 Tax=Desertifilum tharense IPPAS B-1220 TaxID=1781255 RepID=A0A1E5QPH8_9CYAN|nr:MULTISPECIES: glycosyltransferase [Desertifilum]MDA0209790.1 glycosyltransferase [Cyanobacteria bacterium FC1]MBD2310719.1 glycosyltransferase [Desertifilum sp. FACHB-1129]MBD2320756.1 glycosyltransferase [Desertifilum sp. FACHB-866]MBD2330884.1 glycosyltransferase [Desertifilum sp. FACHB-868]OEJ76572.1 glycosyl transferase family A [Desertifilum tharense IPPAS B-1220]
MPLVSVIIPAYNAQKTILETIDSIQKQTLQDLEIIVINDGSKDNTLEILSKIDDPRLKVFSYENGGLPVARNRGIERATGEYLSFIDADDLWTPDKLETQVEALQANPEAGVAYSWTAFIDENSDFLYAWEPLYFQGNVYPDLLLCNFISSGSNILVRRQYIEAAGKFDPTLKSAEDWDYYIRLAAVCPFALVPQYQILYRRSSQSMTSKVDVMETYILKVTETAFAAAPAELQPLKNRSLAHTYRFLSQLCIAHVSNEEGVKQASQKLQKALQLYPQFLLERKTQRLLFKVLLLRLLPYQLAVQFSQFLKKLFPDSSTQAIPAASQD